ncbi:envelope stress response membrane protein PspC [Serratia sp. JSRIV001]|uniref:envelope stress response membrane protein PspC n=1 Tax=Serratia fonticola TaxID=47917 RepID=UPI001AEA5D70|nr:envelope stress response membrane protein PspC [Serratia fonticola]UAN43573.1 envelope stress response membrane protein PspC [Serratia sp. JSRIV001]UAN55093.1 envelope stress response membrane protein PspC [Serratia sp. JSRIV004]MBP0996219.1 envelope stress response membrane protein PspC [Serratia fonticola]MBP1001884.1 envelope stress response membrane protein PspC [Serratia fonticola]MBP1011093.1 envelope stress response membrane protein PspC [Serratia fonticola]
MRRDQDRGKFGDRHDRSYYNDDSGSYKGNTLGSKKLYRVPEEGMLKGVCAGLAHYFDVPVRLIRVIAVLSLFFGLFFITVVAYIALVFVLEEAPASRYQDEHQATPRQLLDKLEYELSSGEQQLRKVERYVTSDTFGVQSRFRQL